MSLILDALSRAEHDKRRAAGVPDLLTPSAPGGGGQRWRRWALGAAIAVGVTLALALPWWVSHRPRPPVVPAERQAPAIATPQVSAPPRAATPAAPPPAERGMIAAEAPVSAAAGVSEDREAIDRLYSATGEVASAELPVDAMPRDDGATDDPAQGIAAPGTPLPEAAGETSAPVSETPVDLEEVLRQVRRETANDALSEHPVPVLASLSKQFRDRVPTLMYLRHDYARGAGVSTVVINGETLREGQRSGPVQVLEILPDSVILRFEGTDFRLRALNSWVNL